MAFLGIGKKKKKDGASASQTAQAVQTVNRATVANSQIEDQMSNFGQQLGSDTQGQGYQGDEFNAWYDYNAQPDRRTGRTQAESVDDRRQIDSWNSRMDEAYAAASRGDMETANRLRSEVESEHTTYAGRGGEAAHDAGIGRTADANAAFRDIRDEAREVRDASLHGGNRSERRDARQEYRETLEGPRDERNAERREGRDMRLRAQDRIGGITTGTRERNASARELSSPMAMIVGETLRDARAMQDPNSETSMRFKDSLTSGALAQIDAASLNAERGIASGERTAQRGFRDNRLAAGGNALGAAAMSARTSERFSALAAGNETQSGAARAAVHGEAAKTYEAYRREFATSSVNAAQVYMQNIPKFRDAYRAQQMQMATNAAGIMAKVGLVQLEAGANSAAAAAQQRAALVGGAFSAIAGLATAINPIVGAAVTGVGALAKWATTNSGEKED
jgi:hypothetical protein